MQRQRGELVPVGEVVADLGGPVQALFPSGLSWCFRLATRICWRLIRRRHLSPQ